MNALSGLIQGRNMLEGQLVHLLVYPPGVVVKVKVKLRFSAPSAGIAEIEQT